MVSRRSVGCNVRRIEQWVCGNRRRRINDRRDMRMGIIRLIRRVVRDNERRKGGGGRGRDKTSSSRSEGRDVRGGRRGRKERR